jgi:hypothetical protein
MQWSKLRSRLLSLVAPSVRKRIDFHLTNYRKLSENANEFWITIDKKRIFSASYSNANIERYIVSRTTGLNVYGDGPEPRMVEDRLTRQAIHDPEDVTSSIRTYFDLEPRIALASSDPILRGLATLDRRIGTRTLKQIDLSDDEHPLVRRLYALRVESLGTSKPDRF